MNKKTPWEEDWVVRSDLSGGGQGITRLVDSRKVPSEQAVLKTLKRPKVEQDRRRMRQEVVNLGVVRDAGGSVPAILTENTENYADTDVTLYFVMEFVKGTTLQKLVSDRGKLTVDEALDILSKICQTIAIGHDLGVVHRDLKPDNVIVGEAADRVTILDYGLSFNSEDDNELTQTEETFRNKFLMLPETNVVGGSRRDPRLDLTAAAGILYYCLTGNHPRLLRDENDLPPHRRPGVSIRDALGGDRHVPYLDAFFNRGFAADIGRRFASVHELVSSLNDISQFVQRPVVEDPVKVAVEVSTDLRANNRAVRLHLFRTPAKKMADTIVRYVEQIRDSLDMFNAVAQQGGESWKPQPGVDDIGIFVNVTVLPKQVFTNQRMIQYRVGIIGEEAAIYKRRRQKPTEGNRPFADIDSEWIKVFPYVASEEPDAGLIVEDVKLELVSAMRSLRTEMDNG